MLAMMLAMSSAAAPSEPPIVIAHRGASGHRPEHSLAAYRLAIEMGADFIEPDLVMTKDGVLVARHENEISGTTDVAARPEYAGRQTTKTIDGERVTGWFTEDFTLAELKTLRVRERLPMLRSSNAKYDGQEAIPTLGEIIALAKGAGRPVGLYPEIKHPSYFQSIGLAMEAPLVAALDAAGFDGPEDPVFIQSFEIGNLKALRGMTRLRLVQLLAAEGGPADQPDVSYADMVTPAGLCAIAAYADAIGPAKALIVPRDAAAESTAPTTLVRDAHAAGLKVHPWTFRSENYFLPAELRVGVLPMGHGQADEEIRLFLELGVDGVFADFPDVAVRVRKDELARQGPPIR